MLVLPVFLTRHSSIKVRRENDCKDKTQILIIKKKKQYYQTLTIITEAFIRFQYILTCWHGSLICSPLEVTSVFTLFVASLFSSLLSFSTCGASSSCIFRSNAASSAFRLFSSSSLFQTLEAISCSCVISFSSVLHLESYFSMYPCIFCRAFTTHKDKEGASWTYDTPSGEKLRFNLLQPLLNTKARTLLRSSSIVTFCAKVRVSAGFPFSSRPPS